MLPFLLTPETLAEDSNPQRIPTQCREMLAVRVPGRELALASSVFPHLCLHLCKLPFKG